MDGQRFDDVARRLANGWTRRGVLAGLAGGALGALAGPARARALARCRADGRACNKDAHCCSGFCRGQQGQGTCETCPSGVVCGDVCCAAGEICSAAGTCDVPCSAAADCPAGEVCCGGSCTLEAACVCPPDTACGGSATCLSCGVTYTTEGTCCPYPQSGYCCGDSVPGAGDGFAICCDFIGGDCPPCPTGIGGVTGNLAAGGQSGLTCGDGDCCADTIPPGFATAGLPPCCLPAGYRCSNDYPCCNACGHGNRCT